jgi:flavin-dependent dehydrogenase
VVSGPSPALQRAQAETVVLADDPSSDLGAWIGPEPTQIARAEADLTQLGVEHPVQDRFDAAVLRALAASGGDLYLTPGPHEFVADGIAAILRYSDDSTTR